MFQLFLIVYLPSGVHGDDASHLNFALKLNIKPTVTLNSNLILRVFET